VDTIPNAPDEAVTQELLARVRAGDAAAGDELYRRHHDAMLFTVRARLGSKLRGVLQSEDVLQSAALEAIRGLDQFEHRGPGSLTRWLHRIVLNKIRDTADYYSAAKRDAGPMRGDSVLAGVVAEDAQPAARYHDERYEKLERALAALPDEMREMLVLRRMEGLSSREAAERTGRSDAAARQLYSRALARVALQMGLSEEDRP